MPKKFGSRRQIAALLILLVLGGAGAWVYDWYTDQCFEEGQQLLLPGSDWAVVTLYSACGGAVVGGYTEVVARNTATREEQVLVRTGDLDHVRTSLGGNGEIVVTLENLVDIREKKNRFQDIEIVYNFTPRDDPQERASYLRWLHNPDDPESVRWFCARPGTRWRDEKGVVQTLSGCEKATK